MPPQPSLSAVDLEQLGRLEPLFDQFDAVWSRGETPRIEEYLPQAAEADRTALLQELVAIEWEWRIGRGEAPQAGEYSQRFPELSAAWLEQFGTPPNSLFAPPNSDHTVIGAGSPGSAGSAAAAAQAEPVQMKIAGYEILREVARGGMGVVYKARQPRINRTVALKMMLSGQFAGREEIRRFQAEAEAAGGLDHPNIVPIYEVGEYQNQPFFSMGFVEGQSLREQLAAGPSPPRQAAEVMLTVCGAIQYAHEKGVIHRDLKPANILMDAQKQPRVTDFGLAKQVATDSGMTMTGQILGTPSYMPPEQAAGQAQAIGPAADVYSLGATLYCLLTGRPPFQAATTVDTLLQVLHAEAVSPRQLNPAVPRDLETIVLKCLQKEGARRYSSAAALGDDLRRYLGGEPILARPVGRLERAWRWCRRKPLAAGLLTASVAVVLLSMVGLWYRAQFVAAAQQLTTAEAVKKVHEFFARTTRVREMAVNPHPGWTWEASEELEQALATKLPDQNTADVRTLAAEIACRMDMRLIETVAEGIDASVIDFSPDGTRLAIAERKSGIGGVVYILEAATRKPLAAYSYSNIASTFSNLFKGNAKYQDGTTALAWSPDGRWLVAGTRKGRLVRWDTQLPEPPPQVWVGHPDEVRKLAFHPSGTTLVSVAVGLKRWDAANDWRELPVPVNQAAEFAISPDGNWLVHYDRGLGRLQLRDANSLAVISSWSQDATGTQPVISPDSRMIAAENRGEITIREICSGELVARWEPPTDPGQRVVSQIEFSADGSVLILVDGNGRIRFRDIPAGREVAPPLTSHVDEPVLGVCPQGRMLAISSQTGRQLVELYEWRKPQASFVIPHPGVVHAVGISPDGKRLAAVTDEARTARDQRWISLVGWSLPDATRRYERRVVYNPAGFPLSRTGLAWNADSDQVFWNPGMPSLLVSDLGSAKPDRLPHSPHGLKLVEVSAAELLKDPHTQGAALIDDPAAAGGQAVRLDGSAGDHRVGYTASRLPQQKSPETWMGMASVRFPRQATVHAGWNFGHGQRDNPLRWRSTLPTDETTADYGWVDVGNMHAKDFELDLFALVATSAEGSAPCVLDVDRMVFAPLVKSQQVPEPQDLLKYGAVAWSPDGQRLWGLTHERKTLICWNADLTVRGTWSNALRDFISGASSLTAMAAGNRWVVCGSRDGSVIVLPAEGTPLAPAATRPGPGGSILCAVLNAAESHVWIETQTGALEQRAVPSGTLIRELPTQRGPVQTLAWSEEAQLLAVAGEEGVIRLYRTESETPEEWLTLRPQAGTLTSIGLSRDGAWLAAVARGDRVIRLWNLHDLAALLQAQGL